VGYVLRKYAAVGVLIAVAVGAVLLVRYLRGPNRESYVAANQELIAQLPRPPGAHERMRQVLSSEETLFGEQLSHTVGYTTHVTYGVPADTTTAAVVRFYRQALADWRAKTWTVDRLPFACFNRDRALVVVSTEGMQPSTAASKSYTLSVDHDGGDCR
jgi:cell division septation protein DedD